MRNCWRPHVSLSLRQAGTAKGRGETGPRGRQRGAGGAAQSLAPLLRYLNRQRRRTGFPPSYFVDAASSTLNSKAIQRSIGSHGAAPPPLAPVGSSSPPPPPPPRG